LEVKQARWIGLQLLTSALLMTTISKEMTVNQRNFRREMSRNIYDAKQPLASHDAMRFQSKKRHAQVAATSHVQHERLLAHTQLKRKFPTN